MSDSVALIRGVWHDGVPLIGTSTIWRKMDFTTVVDRIIDTDLKICLGQLWEIDDLGSKFNFLVFQSCGQLVFRVSKLFFDIFSWKNNFSEHFGTKNLEKQAKTHQNPPNPYKEAIMGFWSPNHGVGCVSSGVSLRLFPANRVDRTLYYVS